MTTAIYETWFGRFQRQTAIQLSGAVMLFVFLLFYVERVSREKQRHDQLGSKAKSLTVTSAMTTSEDSLRLGHNALIQNMIPELHWSYH